MSFLAKFIPRVVLGEAAACRALTSSAVRLSEPFPHVENTKLKITNLSWATSWQTLKDHFRASGVTARYAGIVKGADGRHSGAAFAKFNSPAEAAEALNKLQNTVLDGRNINLEIDNSIEPETNRPTRPAVSPEVLAKRVFLGNMAYSTTSQEISELCSKCGEVVSVNLLKDSLGRSRGCAIVEFTSAESAQNAVKNLHDVSFGGRLVFVREDKGSVSSGPRQQKSY